jgi:acetylornithine/N-succinyldiaminopimelate aminotransferase
VKEVRGLGLMLGMELAPGKNANEIVEKARKRGFLINCTSDKVLRFVPPLIVEQKHVDALIETLDKILSEVEQ